ncbi:DUF4139 domain-containing protein [Planctomycetota bacterium]
MNRHLTEEQLLKYQFNLASQEQMTEIEEHLQSCDECSKLLEGLKKKFAALDLLKDEVEVSGELVDKVMADAAEPVRIKMTRFRMPAWLSAAAAVLVFGIILLVYSVSINEVKTFESPQDMERRAEEPKLERSLDLMKREDALTKKVPAITPAISREKELKGAGIIAAAKVAEDIVSDKPPFAPASAIELVVLPRRDNVQLTIYNSADLTLIRERRNLTLKKGWNWLQFMWANTLIDPTSLSLEPQEQKDKIDIQQLVFPAGLRELGRWLIRSETEGQVPFEITYFTSGLNWRAFYMGTLAEDEKAMQLQGYVRVANNSGEDYENAQTRLIVGKLHILDEIAELALRQWPYGRPGEMLPPMSGRGGGMKFSEISNERAAFGIYNDLDVQKPKEIKKEGLSEYFLYTIEGTETIANQWGKRLLSFDVDDIEVKSLYKYDEQRWGKQTIRFISFANDEEHNLGDTPIPNGDVKIYSQADEQGYLSYVGGTNIKYIPVNEEVELNLGAARLVTVKPMLMDFKTHNYLFDKKKDIAGWDEVRKWKIEITNTRKLPIDIEITRGYQTPYWKLMLDDEQDVTYEKHDVTHARFKLTLPPRSKREFKYTVTTYHGTREEKMKK